MIICETEWVDNPEFEIDFFTKNDFEHPNGSYRLSLRYNKTTDRFELYKKYLNADMEQILIDSLYLSAIINYSNHITKQRGLPPDEICDHSTKIARNCKKHMDLDGGMAYDKHMNNVGSNGDGSDF